MVSYISLFIVGISAETGKLYTQRLRKHLDFGFLSIRPRSCRSMECPTAPCFFTAVRIEDKQLTIYYVRCSRSIREALATQQLLNTVTTD